MPWIEAWDYDPGTTIIADCDNCNVRDLPLTCVRTNLGRNYWDCPYCFNFETAVFSPKSKRRQRKKPVDPRTGR